MKFSAGPFKGRIPKLKDHLLDDMHGSVATNVKFDRGNLAPLNDTSLKATLEKVGPIYSIFRYYDSDVEYWFHWPTDVDCVMGPISGDTHNRAYFTGDGVPQVASAITALTGAGTAYPYNAYTLGLPKPGGAILLDTAIVDDGGTYPAANATTTVYAYRFVSSMGEPGPIGSASSIITIGRDADDGHKQPVRLTGFDVSVVGDYSIATIDIFRANYADSPEWQFVDSIAFGASSYDDTIEDTALGNVLPDEEYLQPEGTMQGIIQIHGAMLAGFDDKTVLMSYEELPHAWPGEYRFVVPDPIVGLGHFGNTTIVLTEGFPHAIQGQTPTVMVKSKIELPQAGKSQACMSKRGIVEMGDAVLYPSTSGIIAIGTTYNGLLTKQVIDFDQWQTLDPTSILAGTHDGKYIGFYDNGTTQAGFIFDPSTGDWSDIDLYPTALYNDKKTGELFLVLNDNELHTWEAGSALSGTWRTKKHITPRLCNMAHAKVDSENYPLTFKLYGDGTLRHTKSVTSRDPFTLPAGYKAEHWYAEIVDGNDVNRVIVAETIEEIRNGD